MKNNKSNKFEVVLVVDILMIATNFIWTIGNLAGRVYITGTLLVLAILFHSRFKSRIAIYKTNLIIVLSLLFLVGAQIFHLINSHYLANGTDPIFDLVYAILYFIWGLKIAKCDVEYVNRIKKILIIFISFSCIMSLPYLIGEFGIIRSNSSFDANLLERLAGIPYAIGSWQEYTAIAIAFPVMATYALNQKKRLIWLLILVPIFIACVLTSLSSILLYLIIGLILLLLFEIKKIKNIGRKTVVWVLSITIATISYFYIESWISALTSNQTFFDNPLTRLYNLIVGMLRSGRAGDTTGRFTTILDQTITAIKRHPVIGSGYGAANGPGGHMHALDIWGWYGIFGEIAFIIFFVNIFSSASKINSLNGNRGVWIMALLAFIQSFTGGLFFKYMLGLILIWLAISINEKKSDFANKTRFND